MNKKLVVVVFFFLGAETVCGSSSVNKDALRAYLKEVDDVLTRSIEAVNKIDQEERLKLYNKQRKYFTEQLEAVQRKSNLPLINEEDERDKFDEEKDWDNVYEKCAYVGVTIVGGYLFTAVMNTYFSS